jgi:EamA domain-containing membrane protein RarD
MTAADLAAAARRNQVPRGILYMVASTVMFGGVNAIVKWELETYSVGEVAFFRSLFAFATVALLILPRSGWGVLRTRRYREHVQRGLSQFGSMTCMMLAFSMLSLGSAIAIGFSAPLFTTLLSVVVLKEKVGVHRWSALVVGFVGVLVVTHPGAATVSWGAFFALANAVLISSVAIAIRRMSATESTETLTLYQMSVITLCTLFLLPLGYTCRWRRPRRWCRSITCRWCGQRCSGLRSGATSRPRRCSPARRSSSPPASTSCGAKPSAAAGRSQPAKRRPNHSLAAPEGGEGICYSARSRNPAIRSQAWLAASRL